MKNKAKLFLCGLLALATVALAGCGSTVDSRDDPLSGYSVNALLPFGTRDPGLAEPTDTPAPTQGSGVISAVTQPWQNEGAPTAQPTAAPTATPIPAPTATYYIPVSTAQSFARLEPGDENEGVMRLQNRLIELGYLYGTADGRYGTQTQNAVKLFQKALGISQTGIANVSLQERLFAGNAPAYTPGSATTAPLVNGTVTSVATYATLVRGDAGDGVLTLQRRLQELGYLRGEADGKFGGQTESAVKAFQARIGLTQSGVASSSLQERLYAADAPRALATSVPAPTLRVTVAPTLAPTAAPTAVPASQSYGYSDLSYGMKNSLAVQQMQNRLKALGYFDAAATGNYYAQTADAVRAFQAAAGLNPTGTATAETLARLYAANAPANFTAATATPAPTVSGYVTLSYGSRGDEVVALQKRLIALGWAGGYADGIYGNQTVSAVRLFQAAVGYEQTGTASVELQTILFSAVAPYNTQQATVAPAAPIYTVAPAASSQYALLQAGDTGEDVKRLQTRLKELGFFNGQIGGNYLTKTSAAVSLFESALGRAQTGVASVELQEIIFSDAAPRYADVNVGYTALEKGDSGNQVVRMQTRLQELGWLSGRADGDFGGNTKQAVAAFQAAAGLSATGSASIETLNLLYSAAAPYAPLPTAVPTTIPTMAPTAAPAPVQYGYQPLQPGDSGDLVANMQARLKELGYFTGNVAGNYKDLTTEAVKRFQAALGYNQDGVASSELLSALYSPNAPAYSPASAGYMTLSKGSSGAAVKQLQQRLIALGWLSGGADGDFGNNTRNALAAFQSAAGLEATGTADSLTQEYLYASDAPVYIAPVVTNPPAVTPPQSQSDYHALQPGDTGDLVKAMQQRLKELGYFDGDIGGNYLTKTTAAVELFQAAVGFPVDGVASSKLLALLYSSSAPARGQQIQQQPQQQQPQTPADTGELTTLTPGSRSDGVLRLQQRLIELGWLTGPADGDYGENTAAAVRAFQYQIAQDQDGVASVAMQERLYRPDARAYVEYRDLAEGDTGEEVLNIQLRLIQLGYLRNTEDNTDGEYGPMLVNAVSLLQTQMGLAPEMIDGRATIDFQNFLFSDNALQYMMIG